MVPRATADSNCVSAPLPATLPGWTAGTYLNAEATNQGAFETAGSTTRFWVDDVAVGDVSWGAIDPGDTACGTNHWLGAPIYVNGGRHTVRVEWDADDTVPEWDETNNWAARQFVWSPTALTLDQTLLSPAPPDRDTTGHVYYNCDGFEFQVPTGGGGWWSAFAVMPTSSSDDVDVRLFDDYTGSTSGFGSPLASSESPAGESDFVLANGNLVGAATRWAGVLQGSDTPGSSTVGLHYSGGPAEFGTGSYGPYTLAPGEIVDVTEIYFSSSMIGTEIEVTVLNSGSADLGVSFYEAGQSHAAKGDFYPGAMADAFGPGLDESFIFTVPSQGYHAIAVWKSSTNDYFLTGSYTLEVQLSPPNLVPTAGVGWDDALVARGDTGCASSSCTVSATLPGDTTATHLSFHGENVGSNGTGFTFRSLVSVDGQAVATVPQSTSVPAGGAFYDLNRGAFSVKGGRRTVSVLLDDQDEIGEGFETDNEAHRQLVWSPLSVASGAQVYRTSPPPRDSPGSSAFNCDAYSMLTGWWGVMALTPADPTDDYDLNLHDDYQNSTTGFESALARSTRGAGLTDFTVVNANHPSVPWGSEWYSGVIQASSTPDTGSYHLSHTDSGAWVTGPGDHGPFTLASGTIVSVHELYFDAATVGRTYRLFLDNDSGGADLGMSLFEPAYAWGLWGTGLVEANGFGAGSGEQGTFTVTTAGYYGLVVYKNGTVDLSASSGYHYRVVEVLPHEIDGGSLSVTPDVDPGFVTLAWEEDCNGGASTNYAIYAGDLGLLSSGTYDYGSMSPDCWAGADLTQTIPMPAGDVFFVVVPHDGRVEGSYGSDGAGGPRPPASTPCFPWEPATTCQP